MSALQGAVESTAPVSRLHEHRPDYPVPTGREEEWRFTPLRSSAKGTTSGQRRLGSAPPPGRSPCVCALAVPAPGRSLRAPAADGTVSMPPHVSFAFPA
jgi:hypothetical protein